MRLYFDCCCYNRPFDDNQSQMRIHDEGEAVLSLMQRVQLGLGHIALGSSILEMEFSRIRDELKRARVQSLYRITTEFIALNDAIAARANELQRQSAIHSMDALHIASAEYGGADVVLTTDDKLSKICKGLQLTVRVMNPIAFLAEVIENDEC